MPSIAACESVKIMICEFEGTVSSKDHMAISSAFVEDGHSCEPQSNRLLFCTMNHPEPIIEMLSSLERSRLTCLLAKEPSVYASSLESKPLCCKKISYYRPQYIFNDAV